MSDQIDPFLLEVLACPLPHHTRLEYDATVPELRCPTCEAVYAVTDGIPVLLPPAAGGSAQNA